MRRYAEDDVRYLHRARLELRVQLELAELLKVYELERDLVPCVALMNDNGVRVDPPALAALHQRALELTAREEARVLKILARPVHPKPQASAFACPARDGNHLSGRASALHGQEDSSPGSPARASSHSGHPGLEPRQRRGSSSSSGSARRTLRLAKAIRKPINSVRSRIVSRIEVRIFSRSKNPIFVESSSRRRVI